MWKKTVVFEKRTTAHILDASNCEHLCACGHSPGKLLWDRNFYDRLVKWDATRTWCPVASHLRCSCSSSPAKQHFLSIWRMSYTYVQNRFKLVRNLFVILDRTRDLPSAEDFNSIRSKWKRRSLARSVFPGRILHEEEISLYRMLLSNIY